MLSTELMKQQVIPLFLSPKGRISRGLFWKANLVLWLGFLILVSCVMIFKEVFKLDDGFQDNGFSFAFLLYFYVAIILTIKRLHDINWSGWLAVPCILTGILWLIAGFIAGTPGKNKHGDNPVEYEKNRLYINRETGLPPPPPPLDNPISKIVLYAIIISFLPSLAALGMVMPDKVEKPVQKQAEEVSSEQEVVPVAEEPKKEIAIKLDFVKKVYTDVLNDDLKGIDIIKLHASPQLKQLIIQTQEISNQTEEPCDWVRDYDILIQGQDFDIKLDEMNFHILDNGLVRADFYNFGKKHQVDFDIQCDGQECKIADVYEPNSYKQELQKIVQKGVCQTASGSSDKEVTVVVQKINDFSESGDGYTFLTKDGQEYYVYNAGGASPRPGEMDIEENETICLKLNPSDGMGDVAAVSKGKCKK